MEKSKELMQQAGIVPELKLALKLPSGGVKTTGTHIVKILDEKLIMTTNYETGKQVATMRYFFEENGEKKQYDVEVKDKNDNLDYKIQRFAEFDKGQTLRLECIRKGPRNYIDIRLADPTERFEAQEASGNDIPIIEEGEGTEKSFEDKLNEPVDNY